MGNMIHAPYTHFVVGADIGQAVDPTAIAVVEATHYYPPSREGAWSKPKPNRVTFDVRHLERLPLRMSYVDQVAHLEALYHREPLVGVNKSLVIDMTGCGRPVYDMFKKARMNPTGITITAGDQETRVVGGWNVAKILLVSRLQAALHSGDLRVAADLSEARTLVSELQDFRARISDAGRPTFGAREGAHDDLVLAVAIACWFAERGTRDKAHVGTYIC